MAQRRTGRADGSSPRPRPRAGGRASGAKAPRQTTGRTTTRPRTGKPKTVRKATRPTRRGVWVRRILLFTLLLVVAVGVTGCAVYAQMASSLPDPDATKGKGRDQSTIVKDRNGRVLARFFAEENRQDVELQKIPQHLRLAVIATEDQRFYEHEGVDPLGIARALYTDIIRGEKAQGGSTITQQYVKQAFVTSEKTLRRKIQEAILAQRVERRYSKDEILELYLNTIYFGHGAYGVEAASRAYFAKGVDKLSVAEAAMIAGVIKSPGRYSPYLEPENAKLRRDTVLKQMLGEGYIDQATYDEAVASPIETKSGKAGAKTAPYFVEWVREQLVSEYGEQAVYRGGLNVRTTLDREMQAAAEKAVADVLDEKGDPSAAIVAVKPGTGEVLAMVGGRDFTKQQFNVATQGRRQPGSAFKPFVLTTALLEGVSPEKAFESGPAKLQVGDQTWSVTGAPGGKKGPMRLRAATEQSVNSVYAQLILDVGADKVVKTAESLGIREGIDPVPAIALGGLETGVSPLEMAAAYGTLAAGGKHAEPYGVIEVLDSKGKALFKAKPRTTDALDPAAAALTTDILTGVIKRGTGKAASIGRPAAGKTGTTQEYRDAWFVGYTPDIATAVWVGYPDAQREMKNVHGRTVTGGSFPAEIWAQFMEAAHKGIEEHPFPKPKGLATVKICSETGGLVTEFCPKPVSALVLANHKPETCEKHTEPVEVVVPDFVGMTKADALARIEELKLVAKVTEKQLNGVAAGTVADQTPKKGAKLKVGQTVTLIVSTGEAANQPPVPSFTSPPTAKVGQSITVDAKESTDDGTIATYLWEFGDGQTAEGKTAKHTWLAPGTYEITLWVTDDRGEKASITRTIKVQ